MKKFANKQGFSLIEIIVAFSVLVVVIVAATNLLVTAIRSNSDNENTLVAYGLAQEGLEALRNIRDSNWLLGADFQGKVGSDCLWAGGGCLPGVVGEKNEFAIDIQDVEFGGDANPGAQTIPQYTPWKIADATEQNSRLCLNEEGWYRSCSSFAAGRKSLFSRSIEVDLIAAKKYRVSSVVRWEESNRHKEVRLSTELTDWKGGGS